ATATATAAATAAAVPARASAQAFAAAWAPWTAYAAGARVTHAAADYEAVQPHTSQPGWEPPNAPALWKQVTGGGDPNAPTAPGAPRITATTATTVSLGWNASTGTVTGYRVYEGADLRATVTGTTATISGLGTCTTHTYTIKAYNASAESPGSTVVVTTAGCTTPPTTLPTAPYVDMGAWPTPSLPEMALASGHKSYTLAFITGAACRASWFGAYDPRTGWAKDQIDALRAQGGQVKVSFGGATGIELAQGCSDVTALYNEYKAVVDTYALTHIDLDIEGSATADAASVTRRSQALARLQQAHPNLKISITLPVLPEGLTADGLSVVRSARDHGVDVDLVNVMAMDYYRSIDYGDAAVQAATSTFNQLRTLYPGKSEAQLWRMVGVTPMLGQNDDGRIYNLDDARQLVAFAQGRRLGLLSFWEGTRDRNACSGPLYRCTNIAQAPYDFTKIFKGYTG
ncbi:carbohydrate-binding protein, partial [Nonomuraea longicatena]